MEFPEFLFKGQDLSLESLPVISSSKVSRLSREYSVFFLMVTRLASPGDTPTLVQLPIYTTTLSDDLFFHLFPMVETPFIEPVMNVTQFYTKFLIKRLCVTKGSSLRQLCVCCVL